MMRVTNRCAVYIYTGNTGPLAAIAQIAAWELYTICSSLCQWRQLSNWTDFDNRAVRPLRGKKPFAQLAMLADADAIVTDVSFLEKVVQPCMNRTTSQTPITSIAHNHLPISSGSAMSGITGQSLS